MITHTFKFEDVLEAYELHHLQNEGAVKIVIDVGGVILETQMNIRIFGGSFR